MSSKTTKHFNGLSESEQERLSVIMEEMGEMLQIIGKIQRHGYESYNPFDDSKTTNRELLEKELGDFYQGLDMLERAKDIDFMRVNKHIQVRKKSIKKYLHHQG